MTDLINVIVNHKIFGEGKITDFSGKCITVAFDSVQKKFVYPDAFIKYLTLNDLDILETINNDIEIKKKNREEEERKQREIEQLMHIQQLFREREESKAHKKKKKVEPRRNIGFKCNICNGGETTEQIGYNGICNDEMIHYNIEKKRQSWCCDDDCSCKKYLNGDITRIELDQKLADDSNDLSVCYESQMLSNWKAGAGVIQSGKNKGMPKKLKSVQKNSLAVLSTRLPDEKEEDRLIFGIFLIDEGFEGNDSKEGYVSTTSEYKIKLSLEEAKKLKFWNYYFNPNKPESIRMGSGLFRYINDDQAIQILNDVVKIKETTPDNILAKEFLDHFCKVNHIDMSTIKTEPMGGLKR